MKRIKFLLPWRGREPGHIDSALDAGVAAELVRRGIAVYVQTARTPPPQTKQVKHERTQA